jgi:hypothetical protein
MSATSLLPHQITEARILIKNHGWKQNAVAAHFGMSPATLCRLLARAETEGVEAVAPRYEQGPRDDHQLTQCELTALKRFMLKKRSRRLAAEQLLGDVDCTEATFIKLGAVLDAAADKGIDPVWPTWFKRACVLTDEERLSFQGPRALMKVEPARPRGRFFIEVKEDGTEIQHPLFPGALFKSDDMSGNNPSVNIDPDTGLATVNRQMLFTVDADSANMLGFTSIARVKDTYTLEDQADHILEIVDAHGMPLRWMIERGPWDNDFWWGVKMPKDWWQTEECPKFRFGGIDVDAGGPIKVMQAFKPKHKAEVEGAFHHIQSLDGHTSIDIGRYRGEFEAAAKKLAQIQGLKNPERVARAAAAFPDQAQRADIMADVVRRFNSEAKRRRMHGGARIVPAELWKQAQTRQLTAENRWRFLPVKKALTVRNAHVSCRLEQHKGREFWFTAEGFAPEWDWHAYLPHGWRVFAVFHPHRLDLGCRIFNGVHPDSPKNPARFPLGMPLGVLPLAEFAPQWREGPGATAGDFSGRREWQRQVARESRMIKGDPKKTVRASFTASRDGRAVSARKGSADPLNADFSTPQAHIAHGAPPAETLTELPARSDLGQVAGRGEGLGRRPQDHEARKTNGAGRAVRSSAATLEELEAEFAAE